VVCVDVVADNATQCAAWIERRGGQALGVTCDVTDEAQVQAMVTRVRDVYGRVDVLVNNAGILGGLGVLEMPLERWSRQIAVNLTGTFLCTKHVARCMVERDTRGSIIVIVSTAGHQGQAGNIAYATSKSGLLNFTRSAAMDLARHGIRHLTTEPYRPRTNGKVERFHQTMAREWAYGLSYRSHRQRNQALPHWLDHYGCKSSPLEGWRLLCESCAGRG